MIDIVWRLYRWYAINKGLDVSLLFQTIKILPHGKARCAKDQKMPLRVIFNSCEKCSFCRK